MSDRSHIDALDCEAAGLRSHAAALETTRAETMLRPSYILRPRLFIDGNQWCAILGSNMQDGVAGFGDSPELAYADFDRAWVASLKGGKP